MRLKLFNKDTCFMILVSHIAIISNYFLVQLKRCWRSSKFLLREHTFIRNRDSDLFLWGISVLCISSMSLYLDEEVFSGSVWGSVVKLVNGVAQLNWFTKSSKFEEGFNGNELSWSFSRSFHYMILLSVLVQQARKFLLLDKELKTKNCAAKFLAIPEFITVFKTRKLNN